MKKLELLSPVGDVECLKAAVQNGANAVYLGVKLFSARANAKNFTLEELKDAIHYAHIRGVQVHLTLNTLIKNEELQEALSIVNIAYTYGIDAIIVQDLGLAKYIIEHFPHLPVHASTQMTIHNLEGVLQAEKFGFSRVVLARELSLSEIELIAKHSQIELECFIHGALCICYSGQCLMSSMIGGRSGNRGKCAQPCRLPYGLQEDGTNIDQGYLLSPRDVCSLELLPRLIDSGVTSFKIEGRMKTPEYVATVTRIYRKYIDLYLQGKPYIIEEQDKKDLLQVFNRGGFSTGHLSTPPNHDLIFKETPTNRGVFVGTVSHYHENKGHIRFKVEDTLSIGDTIRFEKESSRYTVSELMIQKNNIAHATKGDFITIGRMKGNISPDDKIFKLVDKNLSQEAEKTYQGKEKKKIPLDCLISIKENSPIRIQVFGVDFPMELSFTSEIIPVLAKTTPITKERITQQLQKTGNTPFVFRNIEIDLEDGLYISPISAFNEFRRNVLTSVEETIVQTYQREPVPLPKLSIFKKDVDSNTPTISVLFSTLKRKQDYTKLSGIDRVYLPVSYFLDSSYLTTLQSITNTFDTYLYLPPVIKESFNNLYHNAIETALKQFPIKGFVINNLSQLSLVKNNKEYSFIAGPSMNIFNTQTCNVFSGFECVTLSQELNSQDFQNIFPDAGIKKEIIVYGRTALMHTQYCLLGSSNRCYPECSRKCRDSHSYYLKDRLGFVFPVIPDPIQTVTTIYNSKITSIIPSNLQADSVRIDFLEEDISQMQSVINCVKAKKRMEGDSYTNGNLNREI